MKRTPTGIVVASFKLVAKEAGGTQATSYFSVYYLKQAVNSISGDSAKMGRNQPNF